MEKSESSSKAYFFGREWVFSKLQKYLDSKLSATKSVCGILLIGGSGVGKTALLKELIKAGDADDKQKLFSYQVLAYYCCCSNDASTLSVSRFIKCVIRQISEHKSMHVYKTKLRDPHLQQCFLAPLLQAQSYECFRHAVLFPLLEIDPPEQPFTLVVDSPDVGPALIAELLSNHVHLFPSWLLLVCTVRRSSTRYFPGFRRLRLDDVSHAAVARDLQLYLLGRLRQERTLRKKLRSDATRVLQQLHIKSDGCILYLKIVLDGITEGFILPSQVATIPATLNGLFLWLALHLWHEKFFPELRNILNVILASRRALFKEQIFYCLKSSNIALLQGDFEKQFAALSKVISYDEFDRCVIFHQSFAEWLLDIKHCTSRFLCSLKDGYVKLCFYFLVRSDGVLSPDDAKHFIFYLSHCDFFPKSSDSFLSPLLFRLYSNLQRSPIENPDKETSEFLKKCGFSDLPPSAYDSLLITNDNSKLPRSNEDIRVLHKAAYDGNFFAIRNLLDRRMDILDEANVYGQTALNIATRQGHHQAVEILLKCGADPNHTDQRGWTPLRSASWKGYLECAKLLLQYGANVNVASGECRTAIHSASWKGFEDVLKFLVESGGDVNMVDSDKKTALIAASYMGHAGIVECLLEHGAKVDYEDDQERTALNISVVSSSDENSYNVTKILLEHGASVDHEDKTGMTPLLSASLEGRKDICELLMEYDADPDRVDKLERTPLLIAAASGHLEVVKLLLFWGCSVDYMDSEGRTVLSIASAQGNVEIVEHLLQRGLDEMHKDHNGWAPLHYAAIEGHLEICRILLEAGARINECDNDGRHALFMASQTSHKDVVEFLVNNGANMDHRTHDGKTALRVAAVEGHYSVLQFLIERGSDYNYKDADGQSTLHVLALERKMEAASILLKVGCDVDILNNDGRSPLHICSSQGALKFVQLLLEFGANINLKDNELRTPLYHAVSHNHFHVTHILLKHGAIVDEICSEGNTALLIAVKEGREECTNILLEHGADINHRDCFGCSALDMAEKNNNHKIMKIIENNVRHLPVAQTKNNVQCRADDVTDKFLKVDPVSPESCCPYIQQHSSSAELTNNLTKSENANSESEIKTLSNSAVSDNLNNLSSRTNELFSPIYASPLNSDPSDNCHTNSTLPIEDCSSHVSPELPFPFSFTRDGHMKIILGTRNRDSSNKKNGIIGKKIENANTNKGALGLKAVLSGAVKSPFSVLKKETFL